MVEIANDNNPAKFEASLYKSMQDYPNQYQEFDFNVNRSTYGLVGEDRAEIFHFTDQSVAYEKNKSSLRFHTQFIKLTSSSIGSQKLDLKTLNLKPSKKNHKI